MFNRTRAPLTETPQPSTNTQQPPATEVPPPAVFPPTPPEPDRITEYRGRIVAIDEEKNIVTINTNWGNRQAQITPRTQFFGISMRSRDTIYELPPDEAAAALNVATPYDKPLQMNDLISAKGSGDLKGLETFEATQIVVLYL